MLTDAPLLPFFADLRGRRVVVVGGGAVARRKIEPLLRAGARVRVVTPDVDVDVSKRGSELRSAQVWVVFAVLLPAVLLTRDFNNLFRLAR